MRLLLTHGYFLADDLKEQKIAEALRATGAALSLVAPAGQKDRSGYPAIPRLDRKTTSSARWIRANPPRWASMAT